MAAPAKLENYPAWFNKPLPFNGHNYGYSYRDYKNWDDGFNVELLDGIPYMMASPDEWHQWVSGELFSQLKFQLKGKKCQPYSELDVRLFYEIDESDKTVARPDLMVVCSREKVKGKKNCQGVPDFIIEIVSKSTGGKDLMDKRNLYEYARVKEYWAVTADKVYQYILTGNSYSEEIHAMASGLKLQVTALGDIWLDFTGIVEEYGAA